MQRKLRTTDALLFAPILLIGGVGYWQQQRPKQSYGPARIEVRSLQVLPPTPSDVARGFDTRVKLSLGYSGAEPRGWGIKGWGKPGEYALTQISRVIASQPKTSGQKKIEVRESENSFNKENDVYVGTYLMKLRDVPSDKPVSMQGSFQYVEMQRSLVVVRDFIEELKWQVRVRDTGVKTTLPQVSRFTGLKLKKLELSYRDRGVPFNTFAVQVTCKIVPDLVDQRLALNRIEPIPENIYITNPKGQRFAYGGIATSISDRNDTSIGGATTSRFIFTKWKNIPGDMDDLTFHAQISVDDLWPLKIEIPVKDIPREP